MAVGRYENEDDEPLSAYAVGLLIGGAAHRRKGDESEYCLPLEERVARIGREAIKAGKIAGWQDRSKYFATRGAVKQYLAKRTASTHTLGPEDDAGLMTALGLLLSLTRAGLVTEAIAALSSLVTVRDGI